MVKRYCWLNIHTGEFSNSWDEKEHEKRKGDNWYINPINGYKIIEYTCLNDEKFVFYDKMKLR